MPRKRSRKVENDEHTHLTLRVESYDASATAGINFHVFNPQLDPDDRDPLYEFNIHITVRAKSTYPDNRAGDTYELSIYSNDAPSAWITATLKDARAREDKYGSPKYREYRGKRIPVYSPPKGLVHLDKIRGEQRWTLWLPVPSRFASDLLTLLGYNRPLFVAVHEKKEGRSRWIQSVSLQTTDPTEE